MDSHEAAIPNSGSVPDLQMTRNDSNLMNNIDFGIKKLSMMNIDENENVNENVNHKPGTTQDKEQPQTAQNVTPAEQQPPPGEQPTRPIADSLSQQTHPAVPPANIHTVDIKWIQGGSKVYITGSFTGWTKMIKMKKVSGTDNEFVIKLNLPSGTHRFRFVVDNELRFSDYLPTATDSRGNFLNYIEILDKQEMQQQQAAETSQYGQQEQQQQSALAIAGKPVEVAAVNDIAAPPNADTVQNISNEKKSYFNNDHSKDSKLGLDKDDDDMGNGYRRFHEKSMINNAKATAPNKDKTYNNTIPAIFIDPVAMERYYLTLDQQNKSNNNNQWLIPPMLPPHLDHVILNSHNQQSANDGAGFNKDINPGGTLPVPNHVILNHLATTSIKHNTLAVATTIRYKRKYLTQVLYAPI